MSRELLDLAVSVAREAGALVQRLRSEGVEVADTKSSPVDVVTRADRASEELIRQRLLAARPDDSALGEEGDDVVGSSGVRWVVDPIDGTVNYLYGIGDYAISIAAEVDGVVEAGVVFNPSRGELFTAVRGEGAHLEAAGHGRDLRIGSLPDLTRTLVATGFNYEADIRADQGQAVATMLRTVRDVRRIGSCALDLCSVAAGRVDAYVEEGTHLWDHAAGSLVAREAGAAFEIWPSAHGRDLLVCAPADGFERFAGLVRDCGF